MISSSMVLVLVKSNNRIRRYHRKLDLGLRIKKEKLNSNSLEESTRFICLKLQLRASLVLYRRSVLLHPMLYVHKHQSHLTFNYNKNKYTIEHKNLKSSNFEYLYIKNNNNNNKLNLFDSLIRYPADPQILRLDYGYYMQFCNEKMSRTKTSFSVLIIHNYCYGTVVPVVPGPGVSPGVLGI